MKYTDVLNYQIVISLLKQYNIRHLVLSPGSRNIPFVHSVEQDSFFTCYSVVDERSAAYFATGISQTLNEPVLISCTSSSASSNYLPGITEAYHSSIPIVVLTSDRDPYYLGQKETQMINQVNLYKRFTKCSVNLPIVNDSHDFWYCERLVNEALLELDHRGKGPVHINIPNNTISAFNTTLLPKIRKIERILTKQLNWGESAAASLNNTKILIVFGKRHYVCEKEKQYIKEFITQYDTVVYAEHLANIQDENTNGDLEVFHEIIGTLVGRMPDIVITLGGNFGASIKGLLRNAEEEFEHWLIDENGSVIDVFKHLTRIYECSPVEFFKAVTNTQITVNRNKNYLHTWKSFIKTQPLLPNGYNSFNVIRQFLDIIPKNSLLHTSILSSTRITQMFEIDNSIKVFSNNGADGIDGSLSTFIGQSVVYKNLCFLIIGDLSFFYDMNAISIKHISQNVRILLINNGGGGEFYFQWKTMENKYIDMHTAAKNPRTAKGWCNSLGFDYLYADDNESLAIAFDAFMSNDRAKPIILEVFTSLDEDSNAQHEYIENNRFYTKTESVKKSVKNVIGTKGVKAIRKIRNI